LVEVKRTSFDQGSTYGLDQHPLDLVLDQRRIDREARIERTVKMCDLDLAGLAIDHDISYRSPARDDMGAERDAAAGRDSRSGSYRIGNPRGPRRSLDDRIHNAAPTRIP
jgi:hypothetical protein